MGRNGTPSQKLKPVPLPFHPGWALGTQTIFLPTLEIQPCTMTSQPEYLCPPPTPQSGAAAVSTLLGTGYI